MATVDLVGDARRRVERNTTQQAVLQQERTKLVHELGRLAALEESTVTVRKELRVIDEQIEEATAAQPHLAAALRQAEHDEAERTGSERRSRYAVLANERRSVAADIDSTLAILSELMAKGDKAATECRDLSRQMNHPGAASLTEKRRTALAATFTWRMRAALKLTNLPSNIPEGYMQPFAGVEEELLAEEGV